MLPVSVWIHCLTQNAGRVALATMAMAFGAAAKDVGVSAEQFDSLGVTVSEARSTEEQPFSVLPATVIAAPNSRVVIPAPFAGTVISGSVVPGQTVKEGDPLLRVSSADLMAMNNRLVETRAELRKARAHATRQKTLAETAVVAKNDALEAAEELQRLEAIETDLTQAIERRGTQRIENDQYALLAPASGAVVSMTDVGDKVEATGAAATLMTSDEMWLEIQVPASLVRRVQPGFRVSLPGGATGTVVSVVMALDRLTRSGSMLATLPAGTGLVPGQLVNVTLLGPATGSAVSVPADAVAYIAGRPQVFLRTPDGFRLVPVDLLGKSPTEAVVSGSLKPGDKVATSQLPQLENLAITE